MSRDVIKMAYEEGLVRNDRAVQALKSGDEALSSWISCMMYKPVYQNLIHLPVGDHSSTEILPLRTAQSGAQADRVHRTMLL